MIFLTGPAGIVISKIVEPWTRKIADHDHLPNAGIWIGGLERTLIFLLIIQDQPAIIGWLLAAKAILRFNDKVAPRQTEYVLIGTLISVMTGIIVAMAAVRIAKS